jgi:ribosomal protein S18 acetylase RimI-like enzyme
MHASYRALGLGKDGASTPINNPELIETCWSFLISRREFPPQSPYGKKPGCCAFGNDPRADAALALRHAGSTILAARREAKLRRDCHGWSHGHRGWVYYLAVAPAFRRQGGTMLMRSAEQWCRARGVPKLQLMVRSENVEVASFYAALGYDKSDVVVLAK